MEEQSGPGRPTRAEIDQALRDLGEIRAYHQKYLARRAGRGLANLTDQVMGQHQLALTRVIALLERVKSVEVQ